MVCLAAYHDLGLAREVYGDGTPDVALEHWRIAGWHDPSLQEDFLWRPDVSANHKSYPIDRATRLSLDQARAAFFPKQASL